MLEHPAAVRAVITYRGALPGPVLDALCAHPELTPGDVEMLADRTDLTAAHARVLFDRVAPDLDDVPAAPVAAAYVRTQEPGPDTVAALSAIAMRTLTYPAFLLGEGLGRISAESAWQGAVRELSAAQRAAVVSCDDPLVCAGFAAYADVCPADILAAVLRVFDIAGAQHTVNAIEIESLTASAVFRLREVAPQLGERAVCAAPTADLVAAPEMLKGEVTDAELEHLIPLAFPAEPWLVTSDQVTTAVEIVRKHGRRLSATARETMLAWPGAEVRVHSALEGLYLQEPAGLDVADVLARFTHLDAPSWAQALTLMGNVGARPTTDDVVAVLSTVLDA